MTIEIEGLREAQDLFNRALRGVRRATPEAIKDCAMNLWTESVELAPKDSGDLRGSAKAEPTRPDGMEWSVSYGTEYAVVQHENLQFRHEDGQAKYLEKPFVENTSRYIQKIAESVRRAVD